MSEYSELVKLLHRTAKRYALEEIHEAVDALEALEKRVAELEHTSKCHVEGFVKQCEIANRQAKRITELEAENAGLRMALKQLHDAAQDIDDNEMSLSIRLWWREELRTASAALGENDG